MKEKLRHIPEFDGIRGIAALMVMVFHFFQLLASNSSVLPAKLLKFSSFGQTGVTLFFVLSGFLITRILLNSKNGQTFFKPFYVRRSLRIFPLYFLFLAIYYYIVPLLLGKSSVGFSEQWSYWCYLQNFAVTFKWQANGPFHFWSLAVEEHFYLFWPVLVYYLSTKTLQKLIYFVICLAIFIRFLLFSNGYEVFYFTFTNIDSLALGGLLAIQEFKKDSFLSKRNFVILFLISLVPTIIIWLLASGKGILAVQCFKSLFISAMYYALLGFIFCSNGDTVIEKLLRARALMYSGKISYGLYVYHPICFIFITKFNREIPVVYNFILSFSISFIIASLSYYLFEVHFLKLKKYFDYDYSQKNKPGLVTNNPGNTE